RARDVRTPDRATGRLLENRGELDANTELVEALHDALGAIASHVPESAERRFQLARVRQVQTENVRLDITFDGTQLHAGHDSHAKHEAGLRRVANSGNRVMIRQRDRRQTGAFGGGNDVGRRTRTVGRGRMDVKI